MGGDEGAKLGFYSEVALPKFRCKRDHMPKSREEILLSKWEAKK